MGSYFTNYRTPIASNSKYLVPGTRYLVPGTLYLVPGTWYLVPGTWYLVPDLGTISGIRYVYVGGGKCLFIKGSLRGGSPSYFLGEGRSGGERAGALSPPVSIT